MQIALRDVRTKGAPSFPCIRMELQVSTLGPLCRHITLDLDSMLLYESLPTQAIL